MLLIYHGQKLIILQYFELNSTIKVKVLKFDEELSRLSLGIKQLTENPWDKVNDNIKVNDKVSAKVISMNENNVHLIINNSFDELFHQMNLVG